MPELVIAVCDDLAEERAGLARMIRNYSQERGLDIRLQLFRGGEELLEALHRQRQFHILFLDIYMPGLSGVDVARNIRATHDGTAIIFATTSQEHGMDSFDVQASDYLVKPFREEDVFRTLDWCVEHIPESFRCLSIYVEGELRELPLSSIQFVDVYGHQSRIHTGREILAVRRGLDDLELAIHSRDFLRCHRSFLVNMNYIQGVEGTDFQMPDGILVPISSSHVARIRNQFIDWTYIKAWRQT